MIRPGESAIRDLMAIRRRLLARAILDLVEGAPAHPEDGGFPCEMLWLLRPELQKIAGRMARHSLDFRVTWNQEDKVVRAEVTLRCQ
jgi:hypothetical protein